MKTDTNSKKQEKEQFELDMHSTIQKSQREIPKRLTNDMLVLGELNRGAKTFENVQKNTGLDDNELNSILRDLENRGLMKVNQKKGLFGLKVELYVTEKRIQRILFLNSNLGY